MGSLFGGGTTTSNTSSQPWAAQQPYELAGLGNAQTTYNNNIATGPYSGEYVAGPNGYDTNAETAAGSYANGYGAALPGMIAGGVGGLYGAGAPYVSNAEGMASNGIAGPNSGLSSVINGYATGATPASSINPALAGSLNSAGVAGANSLGAFSNGQQQILGQSLSDPTQRLAADAGTYMNSAPVQSAINSTNTQLQQVLNEQTNPSFNRQAASEGNLSSSRAGMGEAMNNENEAIAQGNADASIENNAYNTGLGTASSVYNSSLGTGALDASMGMNGASSLAQGVAGEQLGQSEFGTNIALGAANSGLGNNLNYEMGNANTMLGANGQLGTATGLGMEGATTAGNLAAGDFGLNASAGGLYQTGQQAEDTNALDQFTGNTQYPWTQLDNEWGIVGSPLGQQSTGTQTAPTNILGGIIGTGLGAASLFGSGGMFGKNGAFPSVGTSIASAF